MGELQHCKGNGHVSIAGSSVAVIGHQPHLSATYLAAYHCHQTPNEATEVILIHPVDAPANGLHLLREVWAYVVGNLRAMASAYPDGEVEIRHTVEGVMMPRWTISPGPARELADEISALAGAHQ